MRRRTYVVCESCGEMKEHKGRGLCNACYLRIRRGGTLIEHSPIRSVGDDPCFCTCNEYDPEPIPYFGGSQCRHCWRPSRDEVLAHLASR